MPSLMQRLGVEGVKYVAGLPYRREVARLEGLSVEEFWGYQATRLQRQYELATSSVPYYRENALYARTLDVADEPLSALRSLPVLPKTRVKEATGDFERRAHGRFTATHTTGGTTGTPMRIRAGLYERGFTNAILEQRYLNVTGRRYPRTLRLTGYLDGDAAGKIWQRVPGTNVAYLSIYQLTSSRKAEIVQLLRRFRPEAVHGYASAIVQLARLVTGGEIDVRNLAVVSTSETLAPDERDLIESRLNATVHNEYGSQEGQHLVLECSSRGMHIHPARGIVEILASDSDSPAQPGELGRVVVTGLLAREMPLLRYDIGDSAISTGYANDCHCGSRWPMIGQVFGRSEDLVRTPDGRRIGLLSHSTLKEIPGITASQILQTGYDRFTYLMEVDGSYRADDSEAEVRRQLQSRLGYVCHVDFTYDQPIPRTGAGKVRAVVVDFDG